MKVAVFFLILSFASAVVFPEEGLPLSEQAVYFLACRVLSAQGVLPPNPRVYVTPKPSEEFVEAYRLLSDAIFYTNRGQGHLKHLGGTHQGLFIKENIDKKQIKDALLKLNTHVLLDLSGCLLKIQQDAAAGKPVGRKTVIRATVRNILCCFKPVTERVYQGSMGNETVEMRNLLNQIILPREFEQSSTGVRTESMCEDLQETSQGYRYCKLESP